MPIFGRMTTRTWLTPTTIVCVASMVVAGLAVALISHGACGPNVLSGTQRSDMCGTAGTSGFREIVAFGFPLAVGVVAVRSDTRRLVQILALTFLAVEAVLAAWIASNV